MEAPDAGDQGLGFAVVGSKLRSLEDDGSVIGLILGARDRSPRPAAKRDRRCRDERMTCPFPAGPA